LNVVCGRAHIKEASRSGMGRTSDLISAMTLLGIHHDKNRPHIDLVAWSPEDTVQFQRDLEVKFQASPLKNGPAGSGLKASLDFDDDASVRRYFTDHIALVTDALRLTALTEYDDDLLIMKSKTDHYVYFGGVTKTLVYISCWMVVPEEHETEPEIKPKLLFWFLNTLYVGQLQGLGETAVDANMIEQQIDLNSIPVYANRIQKQIDLKSATANAS